MEGTYLPVLLVLILCKSSHGIQPPNWDKQNMILQFDEDTPVGKKLGTIKATGRNGEPPQIVMSDLFTRERISLNFTTSENAREANIFLLKQMDRDYGESEWKLHFKAFDSQIHENQVPEYTVTILILDVNDNPPHFLKPFYTVEVKEDDLVGKHVIDVTATDPDNGAGGVITYSMKPSGQASDLYHNAFKIQTRSEGSTYIGNITLNGQLDYAELSFYQYEITASDKGTPPMLGNASLVIKVIDIQNTPPYFQRLPYVSSINENSANDTELSITALAFDGDTGIPNKINYFFSNRSEPCYNLFGIDSISGHIKTRGNLDRDAPPLNITGGVCRLTLQARELNTSGSPQNGNSTTDTPVVITVNDENDNAPVFTHPVYNANITENISGIPLNIVSPGDIFVQDIDQTGNNKFKLEVFYEDGNKSQGIQPVPRELYGGGNVLLQLYNNFKFDYEKQKNATYILKATDSTSTSPFFSTNCTINIDIIDSNDNDPIFDKSSYTAYVLENQTVSTNIINITATDEDSGIYGDITYQLSGDDHFVVDNKTGEIRTKKPETIDREKRDTYYLTLVATDGGGRRNIVGIVVNVRDINDNAPVFFRSSYMFALTENQNLTERIIISADDEDQANLNNSKITYSLDSTTSMAHSFSINSTTGEINLEQPIDYESLDDQSTGIIHLVVTATDQGSPSLSSNVSVDIEVEDVNDKKPVFFNESYTASISEYASPGSFVQQVSAVDKDGTLANSRLSYYIEKGSKDKFRIDGQSGNLTVDLNARFDRETEPIYNLTILAIDRGSPSLTGTTMVYVHIVDVNDEKPYFEKSSYKANVNESSPFGTTVINCIARDPDLNSSLEYSVITVLPTYYSVAMKNNSVEDYFRIANNGTVYVNSSLDRETVTKLDLILLVNDSYGDKNLPQTATVALEITILDSNDCAPKFTQPNYTVHIQEGKLSSTVLTMTATDEDDNNHLVYAITNNPLNEPLNAFTIDNITGEVSRKPALIDRETNETLIMVVSVNDGIHVTKTNVTLVVDDVNDNYPEFEKKSYKTNLTENNGIVDSYNQTFVYKLSASDADEGRNAELSYFISSGSTNGVFSINQTTGIVTVNGHVDREQVPEYVLTIIAMDNPEDITERKTNTTTLTITINDVNDCSPKFTPSSYTGTVVENVQVGASVLTVTAKDDDEGINKELNFTLIDHSDLFRVDETGHIFTTKNLLGLYGEYLIQVVATDHGTPPLNNYTDVHITVIDINDNPPVFNNFQNKYKIYECAKVGTVVTTLNATDADYGINSLVEYLFEDQQTDNYDTTFALNNETGTISTTVLLDAYNRSEYKMRVQARDHGTPQLSSKAHEITIEVIDINDHPPEFKYEIQNVTLKENVANQTVLTVHADDVDKNSETRYSLVRNFNDIFTIHDVTGSIVNTQTIDREKTTSVSLRVKATDISSRNISTDCDNSIQQVANTTEMDVYIAIQDVNDNPPVFTEKFLTLGIRRNVKLNSTVLDLKLKVTDRDVGINAQHFFDFKGEFNFSSTTLKDNIKNPKACLWNDKQHLPLCLTPNGTILTNILFEENMKGYLQIPLLAKDAAGNDTALLQLYIISDSQTLAILIHDNKAYVQSNQDAILRELREKTGFNFTANGMESYMENGILDAYRTYLYCHVVGKDGNVLSAQRAKEIFDENSGDLVGIKDKYKIGFVKEYKDTLSTDTDEGIKTTYIMIAVIVLLGITVMAMGFLYCKSVSRYQRKLKAQTTKSVDQDSVVKESHPGTNVYARSTNPLLNKEGELNTVEYDKFDELSVTSYDSDHFQKREPARGDEEKGATMDMYEEELAMQGDVDALAMVLQQHKKEKAASLERLDQTDPMHERTDSDPEHYSYINEGFELNLETTEV